MLGPTRVVSICQMGRGAVLLLLLSGCWSAPTPLAPAVGGSVGEPHKGVLTGAAELPDRGDGYKRLRDDDIRYGHPRLVAAIERAAARVAAQRPGGAPLVVADLSAKQGGRIAKHRSHRSGRDADILFYVQSPDGRSLENPGFYRFGADGLALHDPRRMQFVMLDVDRTWLFVEALTEDHEALIQWMFVARWIEALLMEHARSRGVDTELLRRAAHILRQPGDSFPHDDHFHIRIACAREEYARGCSGGGYRWDWLPEPPKPPGLSDDALISLLLREP